MARPEQSFLPPVPPGPIRQRIQARARQLLADSRVPIYLWGRIMHPYWRWAFHSFGANSIVQKPAALLGAPKIAIGADCMIFRGCWLSVTGKACNRPDPALQIGDRVRIRPYTTLWSAESLIIEDDVNIAKGCLVSDATHRGDLEDVTLGTAPAVTAPTRIGRGAALGENAAVLLGSQIGEGAAVGANSVVQGTIPPHSIAAGIPARVIGKTGQGRAANRDRRGVLSGVQPAETGRA